MRKEEESWDDLEIFTSRGVKIGKQYVSITRNSIFMFNSGFVHHAQLTNLTHVILGYSSKKNAITFNFTKDAQSKGAHKMIFKSNSAVSGSRSFFNYHSLDPKQLEGRYIPQSVKIPRMGELWVIYLNQKQIKENN